MLEKDPYDIYEFTIDWSPWLQDGVTISSAEIQPVNSLQVNPENDQETTNTATEVKFWLGGGAPNVMYYVPCSIETSDGGRVQRSFPLWVRQK